MDLRNYLEKNKEKLAQRFAEHINSCQMCKSKMIIFQETKEKFLIDSIAKHIIFEARNNLEKALRQRSAN